MGTGRVPRHISIHLTDARVHKGTVRVPGHIWAPEKCPGKYCHQNGSRAHMGTGMVPGHIWAPECAWATMGTVRVPGHI